MGCIQWITTPNQDWGTPTSDADGYCASASSVTLDHVNYAVLLDVVISQCPGGKWFAGKLQVLLCGRCSLPLTDHFPEGRNGIEWTHFELNPLPGYQCKTLEFSYPSIVLRNIRILPTTNSDSRPGVDFILIALADKVLSLNLSQIEYVGGNN